MSSEASDRSSSTTSTVSDRWQTMLQDLCRRSNLAPPVYNILSDRRGGRTAWSSTVIIEGHSIQARFWYDGQYVNNAKEDAAEVALQRLVAAQQRRREQAAAQQNDS